MPAIPPPPGPAALIQGDALCLPFADETIDLIVTSPPYFNLRAYTDQGGHLNGQLGSEPTPLEFLSALWAATGEMKRVLKPGGSIFVNLGDKYAGNPGGPAGSASPVFDGRARAVNWTQRAPKTDPGVREKSLLLLPEAYRLGCTGMLAALGGPDPGLDLIARSVIVWAKPNGLPESVRDRVRRSHEDWVHLVKSPRYYSAVDEIREPHAREWGGSPNGGGTYRAMKAPGEKDANLPDALPHPLGKLPGSVWSIPSEPLRLPLELGIDHYAAFPSEWPRRLILGFSPPGICTVCGEGRVPVVDKAHRRAGGREVPHDGITRGEARQRRLGVTTTLGMTPEASILGYACACTPSTDHPGTGERHRNSGISGKSGGLSAADPARSNHFSDAPKVGGWREYHLDDWVPPPTRPAVILDPFSGTGTTVLTARALGRLGVGVDLSFDYCRAAAWRVWEGPGVQRVRDRTWPPPPKPRRARRKAGPLDGAQLRLVV